MTKIEKYNIINKIVIYTLFAFFYTTVGIAAYLTAFYTTVGIAAYLTVI